MESIKELPHADFSLQWEMEESLNIEEAMWKSACDISRRDYEDPEYNCAGVLAVIGTFGRLVEGIVQMGENPVRSYLKIEHATATTIVEQLAYTHDGAIIIHDSGQVLGAGLYLTVDNPLLNLPGGCGTRHKAAASFSLRDDVSGVLTISEETGVARLWKKGKVVKSFDPRKGGQCDE